MLDGEAHSASMRAHKKKKVKKGHKGIKPKKGTVKKLHAKAAVTKTPTPKTPTPKTSVIEINSIEDECVPDIIMIRPAAALA